MARSKKTVKIAPELLEAAASAGRTAYHSGLKAAPHGDLAFAQLYPRALADSDPDIRAMVFCKLCDAWSSAWHGENLRAAW